jgi:hypothetical protein
VAIALQSIAGTVQTIVERTASSQPRFQTALSEAVLTFLTWRNGQFSVRTESHTEVLLLQYVWTAGLLLGLMTSDDAIRQCPCAQHWYTPALCSSGSLTRPAFLCSTVWQNRWVGSGHFAGCKTPRSVLKNFLFFTCLFMVYLSMLPITQIIWHRMIRLLMNNKLEMTGRKWSRPNWRYYPEFSLRLRKNMKILSQSSRLPEYEAEILSTATFWHHLWTSILQTLPYRLSWNHSVLVLLYETHTHNGNWNMHWGRVAICTYT